MAYAVVWTRKSGTYIEDFFVIYEDKDLAAAAFRQLLTEDGVYCAAVTQVLDATEPHWMDDVGPSKNVIDHVEDNNSEGD